MAALDFVVLLFLFGLSAGLVARLRGNPFWIWFLIGFAMPIFGTIAALVARSDRNEPRRRCEECGAILPIHNQVCTHCGADLNYPDEILPSPEKEREVRERLIEPRVG
jgi:hypothetical protein